MYAECLDIEENTKKVFGRNFSPISVFSTSASTRPGGNPMKNIVFKKD